MSNKLVQYFKDSFSELGKVTWPTKNQAVLLTVVVIIFCAVFAALLGALDLVFGIGLEELLKLAGGN
ncbi:preprotein translocase subunit SecE [Candidatus Peregrinibacteria bacterium CG22_combo_CG10-13_8_21_14_all_44_10]|nr:MAG: preprotein translocase subunit SecE [Candidatus Peregrinibacteria bacterium CG2_30_44_17]PIP66624.1 MAG: preprotein translocase subunit SecE [Candidatus Peregrinibacteria bacterium CG22_combo_CG10-13_8_21_14_all_44_10]PIS03885.1 MAG: preprotein translocase subunit SecE [Candidatus Peregrinibacteria bacterium CG10_big_fil_rev_8_21_14_0_10_44_7]PIX79949.1 MAG: preprotein translocase subunit SecE [Candidatus Peregrinibacteria bacterium CG_4_10_14_3_um_filter_44_21]PJB88311.1 MAG: preprotei